MCQRSSLAAAKCAYSLATLPSWSSMSYSGANLEMSFRAVDACYEHRTSPYIDSLFVSGRRPARPLLLVRSGFEFSYDDSTSRLSEYATGAGWRSPFGLRISPRITVCGFFSLVAAMIESEVPKYI